MEQCTCLFTKGKKSAGFVKASLSVENSKVKSVEHNYPVDLDFNLGKWAEKKYQLHCQQQLQLLV